MIKNIKKNNKNKIYFCIYIFVFLSICFIYVSKYEINGYTKKVIPTENSISNHSMLNNSKIYETIDHNSKCSVHKIKYNNKFAEKLYIGKKPSIFTCTGYGEIAPDNHIIQIEERIPKESNKSESYIFKLKKNRLKDIYGLELTQVACFLNKISKIEGHDEGNFRILVL